MRAMEPLSDPVVYTLLAILIFTLPWKGVALWMAARRSHTTWFIILLVVNSLAILEIIYIFFVAKRYIVEEERTNAGSKDPSLNTEK